MLEPHAFLARSGRIEQGKYVCTHVCAVVCLLEQCLINRLHERNRKDYDIPLLVRHIKVARLPGVHIASVAIRLTILYLLLTVIGVQKVHTLGCRLRACVNGCPAEEHYESLIRKTFQYKVVLHMQKLHSTSHAQYQTHNW